MKRLLLTIGLIACLCVTMGPSCNTSAIKAIPKKTVPTKSLYPRGKSGGGGRMSHYQYQSQQEDEPQYYYNQAGGITVIDSGGNIQGFTVPNGYGGVDVYDGKGQRQGGSW
jgi:hypothetical protein